MDGTMFNVIKGIHQQISDCKCSKNRDCPKCLSLVAALIELECVKEWEELSANIHATFFPDEVM